MALLCKKLRTKERGGSTITKDGAETAGGNTRWRCLKQLLCHARKHRDEGKHARRWINDREYRARYDAQEWQKRSPEARALHEAMQRRQVERENWIEAGMRQERREETARRLGLARRRSGPPQVAALRPGSRSKRPFPFWLDGPALPAHAKIVLDMRNVAHYGTRDDTDNPPQGTETAF